MDHHSLQKAAWIWPVAEFTRNQRANFFFEAEIDAIPATAEAVIGCETRYWLFVNGKLAVFEGGLFRESTPGDGFLSPSINSGMLTP